MSLTASDWFRLRPGARRWLSYVLRRGYVQGATLAEGPWLQDDADGAVTAERVLLAFEAEGLIRRGSIDPSYSQLAFSSLGNMARRDPKDPPTTWYAWHPPEGVIWSAPAERCDFCDTGKCWTHG